MPLPAWLLVCWLCLAPQDRPAARGQGGLTLGRVELEQTLVERYGYAENGRELLDLFLKARLLENLAVEKQVRITDAQVTRRWQDIEKSSRAAGASLEAEMQKRGLTPEQFRDFLRLALIQEDLTRKALGLAERASVSGDQQEIWIRQEIAARGVELLPPSSQTGIMLRCGEISVTREEFGRFLRERLPRDQVQESAWHLLLLHAIEKRMPDLSVEARRRAVDQEVARRRTGHQLEFPTITFEQRLGATGRTLETLQRDPSVGIAALSRLWVDRTAGPAGLRATYEEERELFESRYGEAIRAAMIFRVAGRFVNDLCPRTFEAAEAELGRFAERCDGKEEFAELVQRYSEEPNTKKQKGDLGWVTRGDARVPAPLREALFRLLDTGGTLPERGRAVGPVRLDSGVALLWATERRPSPDWEEMKEHVHEELRRRFIEELMPQSSVQLLAGGE